MLRHVWKRNLRDDDHDNAIGGGVVVEIDDDDDDDGDDDGEGDGVGNDIYDCDDDNIYIMMKCVYVCHVFAYFVLPLPSWR